MEDHSLTRMSVVVPASDSWTAPSGSSEPGLRVHLSLPTTPTSQPVPVLVLLDGDFMFLTATEFARTLGLMSLGDFPPVAVVGVMRDEPNPMAYITSRFRDFTPDEWTLPGPFAADNAMASKGTGGASEFLRLLVDVVLPQVRARMDAAGHAMGDCAIGGWSLSGLFAAWAWLEHSDVFPRAMAITPSLWWNDASILSRAIGKRPASHRLFVCAGEHEEGDVAKVYPQRFANADQRVIAAMVRNAETFGRRAAESGASVDSAIYAGEHHVTVQSSAIARGMLHLFG